jgi:hypothetical protein
MPVQRQQEKVGEMVFIEGFLASREVSVAAHCRLTQMANRFYIVTVRTYDKGGIVVCVILPAQTWWPVIFATSLKRRVIKGPHLFTRIGSERNVHWCRRYAG